MRASLCVFIASLATIVSSSAVNIAKSDSPLSVNIFAVSNTLLKAVVSNNGAKDLNLLNSGTFLDKRPVEKVTVFAKDMRVPFEGIRARVSTQNISSELFTELKAGQSLEVQWDTGAVHNLSQGGKFHFVASGAIPYAEAGSTELSGSAVPFRSNTLELQVDGEKAALVPRAVSGHSLSKRAVLQSNGCTGTAEGTTTRAALAECARLANNAAVAATSGSASKFNEYFKTTSQSTRTRVASIFRAVANECGTTNSGGTKYFCKEQSGTRSYCGSGTIAYTNTITNVVVNCNIYYNRLPLTTKVCHDQDQSTTTLHEFTHAPGVVSAAYATDDRGYGYRAAMRLSAAESLDNADSFALYANALDLGC